MKITTKWGEKIDKNNPLPEYPRPQFERDSFINLNGVWSYLISKKKTEIPAAFEGEIVVPFSPECQLSGVERVVMPDDFLYYEREFDLPEEFIKGRVILNFGAVDYILGAKGVPTCECGGVIKPDVVLYEEPLDDDVWQGAWEEVRRADTLIVGGSSLTVYPAAGLVDMFYGKNLCIINATPTPFDRRATYLSHDSLTREFENL